MLFHTYVAACSEKSNFIAMVCTRTGVDLYCFRSRKMPESPEDLLTPTAIFFPGLFSRFSLFFAHFWWFGGWGFGSWIGFLGLVFSVDGVYGLWCGAFWDSLYKN